jgi:lipopolysaccharide/colanic/teichoic acid biosynthesis glycosyltransferase
MRRAARLLMYLGIAGTVVGLSKVHAAWVAHPSYDYTGSARFSWSFTYVALLCLAAYGVGLPDLVRGRRAAAVASLFAAGAGAVAMSAVQLVVGDSLLPRFVVFGSAAITVLWCTACSLLASGGRSRAEQRDRVVVVGAHSDVEMLQHDLALAPERHAQIVAALDGDAATRGDRSSKPLVDAVTANRATVVVLTRAAQADETIVGEAAMLHEAGIRIRTMSLFYEEWLGKLPISELERVSLMFDVGELHRARYGRVKRLTDVAIALAGLPFLALAVPVVFVGDLVANGGPLLYRQERVGQRGHVFRILKFRTMEVSKEPGATAWTSVDDPRVTPFGQLLRRTHVDELPQLVNILRGELSLVGPRPEQPHYVAELTTKIPFYNLRHLVRPGLTGWAQVKHGYAGTETDALEKLQYEFYYLRYQSLRFDLRIVGRTIRSVVGMGGR